VRSTPDGYTIAMVSGSYSTNAALFKLPYDPINDVTPIALIGETGFLVSLHPSVPAKNIAELIALAKAKPNALNFASTGTGGITHLATELFDLMAGIKMTHIPYKGTGPALIDLLGGQVQMVFLDLPVLLPQVKAGKLRPIAVGAEKRVASVPDVPTTAEVGMPTLLTENWYGMVAPAGTPKDIVATLNKAAVEAIKDPAVVSKLSSLGAILVGNSPDEFHAFIASETAKWAKVIKDAGVQAK